MSKTMSIQEQPCSSLSVQGMKKVSLYSPNVVVLSNGRAISQRHRTLWHQKERVFLVGNVVQCNAVAHDWSSLFDVSYAVTMLTAKDGFHVLKLIQSGVTT